MKVFLPLLALLFITSCNSVKRSERFFAEGSYDQVIDFTLRKLQRDPNGKKTDQYLYFLEQAFFQVVEDDKRKINLLQQDNNPANSREIYYLYCDLEKRQDAIRPIKALYTTNIKFEDYTEALLTSKNNFAQFLNNEATRLLNTQNKMDARIAFQLFEDLKSLQSNFPNVDNNLNEARFLGTDFVLLTLTNNSNQILPFRLQQELLNINTYKLDDFWTQYHNEPLNNISYNYGVNLQFQDINISPEFLREREILREKTIKDGWEYVLDPNGNVAKDSLGNDIKKDKFITVSALLLITEQRKEVQVGGNVIYRDLWSNRTLNTHPLATQFLFENVFATFRGDQRALTEEDILLTRNQFFPFPSNQQMVLDAGQEIKERLRVILSNHRF